MEFLIGVKMGCIKRSEDISREFHFYRYQNGIKLVRPENAEPVHSFKLGYATGLTVQNILDLPFNTYFYGNASTMVEVNDRCAETTGLNSPQEAIGKNLRDFALKPFADPLIQNNEHVLKEKRISIFKEYGPIKNNQNFDGLTIKSPWYNEKNEIVGLFGITIVDEKQDMAVALNKIASLALLAPVHSFSLAVDNILQNSIEELSPLLTKASYSIQLEDRNLTLSKMEIKTLIQLIRGLHAGEISLSLNIKQTTVESYLANIKNKLGVFRKSELISFVLDNQLLNKIIT